MVYPSRKYAREMHDVRGSGEPLCEYNPHVIDEADNGDLHDMPRVRQIGATDDARRHKSATRPRLSPPQHLHVALGTLFPQKNSTYVHFFSGIVANVIFFS